MSIILNLTEHAIIVEGKETFPPSGQLARVSETTEVVGNIDGIEITRKSFGEVTGLPEKKEDTYLICSILVLQASPHRDDLLAPTDFNRVNGVIQSCNRLCKL